MAGGIKRWAAKRKTALVLYINQGKTTVLVLRNAAAYAALPKYQVGSERAGVLRPADQSHD